MEYNTRGNKRLFLPNRLRHTIFYWSSARSDSKSYCAISKGNNFIYKQIVLFIIAVKDTKQEVRVSRIHHQRWVGSKTMFCCLAWRVLILLRRQKVVRMVLGVRASSAAILLVMGATNGSIFVPHFLRVLRMAFDRLDWSWGGYSEGRIHIQNAMLRAKVLHLLTWNTVQTQTRITAPNTRLSRIDCASRWNWLNTI